MRLIDADVLLGYVNKYDRGQPIGKALRAMLEKSPTVDAVPVRRCKDCAFYLTGYNQTRYCAKDGILKRETYYCAGAERKE